MINERKVAYLRELFNYWAGKYNVPKNIKVRIDNHNLCAVTLDKKEVVLYYNPERVSAHTKWEITELVLHELGHIINDMPYSTESEQIISEFVAEQFAVNVIKENYAKILPKVIKMLVKVVNSRTTKQNKVYQFAYKKIAEVQEIINRS